jgi:hypothetical protein
MGSFFKPKAVPIPQTPVSNPIPTPAPSISSQPEKSDAEVQAEAREQNLLRRNRGRFGTITTGFTGFLSPSKNNDRKTLLGE